MRRPNPVRQVKASQMRMIALYAGDELAGLPAGF
jgi:hypothetical protein